eukprot:4424226-Pleurochrysis_carterae.AAC.4
MPVTRLCLSGVEPCDEIVHDGPIVDGRPAYPFARQNGGDHFRFLWCRFLYILDDQPTRAHTEGVPSRDRATENAPQSDR